MIPKLEEFTVEELQEQLKDKKIDKEFLIEYIVKRDKVYNKLIDKIDSMTESYETDAEAKFYEYVDKYESRLQQRIDKAKIEISALMSRYFYEEDFYIEDTDLDKILQILDKGEPNNE